MRRHEREITGIDAITDVLARCDVLRIAMNDEDAPYIVPVCFGFTRDGDQLSLYFHSAKEGRKVDLLRANPMAGFEAGCALEIVRSAEPCHWTAHYESVIGTCKAVFLTEPGEKARAMDVIMRHCGAEGPLAYPPEMLDKTLLVRLDVLTISGKRNPTPG